jgi:hypothetical protein
MGIFLKTAGCEAGVTLHDAGSVYMIHVNMARLANKDSK